MVQKSPSEQAFDQFESIMEIGRLYGVHYYTQLLPPRLRIVIVLGAFSQIVQVYGLYCNWPSVSQICSSLSVYTLVLQLFVRLIGRFVNNDEKIMLNLRTIIVSFYEREQLVSNNRPVLLKNLESSAITVKVNLLIYFILYNMLSPTAWFLSWYYSEYILFTPICIPYTDPKTTMGFYVNSAFLAGAIFVAYIAFMSTNILYLFTTLQATVMVDMQCLRWREFGEKLLEFRLREESKGKITMTTAEKAKQIVEKQQFDEIEINLKTLIESFNEYTSYIELAFDYMYMPIYTIIFMNSLAIAMSMVVALTLSKAIGGSLMLILFFDVLVPCMQGTVIANNKGRLFDEIWSFPWYELSNSKQKTFLQFMHLVQTSSEYHLPIIGDINMELFTDVINGAYSYYMFLLTFMDLN